MYSERTKKSSALINDDVDAELSHGSIVCALLFGALPADDYADARSLDEQPHSSEATCFLKKKHPGEWQTELSRVGQTAGRSTLPTRA